MKDRIDPLIAERAPWLFAGRPGTRIARAALERLLGHSHTLRLAQALRDAPSDQIMSTVADLVVREPEVTGLGHLPGEGAALIVANHPTGIADGLVLDHLIRRVRPDRFYFANSDILRVFPQMESLIVPVEWRPEKRTHSRTRDTMVATRAMIEAGRLGVIFPSGRLARRRGLTLHERPWMASAAMIARKFNLPVIPVNMAARNSALFYLFDAIHPTLRDITLFHETLNKRRQTYRVTIGAPVMPHELPMRSEDAIEMLRERTLSLGAMHPAPHPRGPRRIPALNS